MNLRNIIFDINQQTNSTFAHKTLLGWGQGWNRTNTQGIGSQIRHFIKSYMHFNLNNYMNQSVMQTKFIAKIINTTRIWGRKCCTGLESIASLKIWGTVWAESRLYLVISEKENNNTHTSWLNGEMSGGRFTQKQIKYKGHGTLLKLILYVVFIIYFLSLLLFFSSS